jgi:polyhydroxybutyrate depolymerase
VEDEHSDPAVKREVERVIPASYDGTTPQPMIVSLHGFTSNIDQIDLFSALPTAADSRGYVLLTPQALPATVPIGDTTIEAPFWNVLPDLSGNIEGVHDDVGFILELIDDTVSEICIDPDRVFVTGNSNGAGMTAALACADEGQIAAIAPVSGINLSESCNDVAPVSVIAFHGDADPLVSYEGGSAATAQLDTPSVVGAVGSFAGAAGCDPDPTISAPFEDIELRRWSACEPGIGVELYTILGGGHTWPGMLNYVDPARLSALGENQELAELAGVDIGEIAGNMTVSIEATKLMLDFFDEHPRTG